MTEIARIEFLRMLKEREEVGIATYGTTLETFNERSALQDLKEELIDAWQYAIQMEEELRLAIDDPLAYADYLRQLREDINA